jgi:mono/diheme cytochrome c family protein
MRRQGVGMINALRALLLALLVLFLAGCSLSTQSRMREVDLNKEAVLPVPPPDGEAYPIAPPSVERGAALYAEKCVACHGVGGAGDGARAAQIRSQGKLVANLVNPPRLRAIKPIEWHGIITIGRIQNLMPGFSGSLNGQDRWDVLAYVWALGTNEAEIEAGRAIYGQRCASCHGANGEGTPKSAPAPAFSDGRWLAEASLLDIAAKMTGGPHHAEVGLADSESERLRTAQAVRALGYAYVAPEALRQAKITGDGVLSISAINATTSKPGAADTPVILRALDENGEVFSQTARLDAAGIVTFTGLPQRIDYFYQAELDYRNGRFYASPSQILTTTQVVTNSMQFFETTTDPANISINKVLFAVQDLREAELTMVEIYDFDHVNDRAYVGQDGRTLKISVPKDAKNVRFDGLGFGKRFIQDGDVIFDTDVTVPGSPAQRITLIYELPYRPGVSIDRRVYYPVSSWNIFLPAPDGFAGSPLTASGALQDDGVREADGTKVRLYSSRGPIAKDGAIAFQINGQPLGNARPGSDTRELAFALMGLAVALAAAGLLYIRVRAVRRLFASPAAYRHTLLTQLADLDARHAAGKVRAGAYARDREALKQQLREIWK